MVIFHPLPIRLSREGGEIDRLARLKIARREGIAIGEKRGRAEGSHAKAVEMARSMIEDNFPDSTIAKHTGLSVEEIQKLK